MEQGNPYDKIVKLKVKYATILFVLSLLFIISIIFINTTLKTNEKTNLRLQNLFDNASNHLANYRSFKLKNSNLYSNLIIASVTNGNYSEMDSAGLGEWNFNYIEIQHNISDGEIHGMNTHFSNYSDTLDTIIYQAEKFGIQCEHIFSQENDNSKRLRELNNIADAIFTNKKLKKYLHKYILKKLNNIYDSNNWHQIIRWIVYGEWPASVGMGAGLGPGISYTNRFPSYDNYSEKEYHLYQTLLITDKNSIGILLRKEWENAYLKKENYHLDIPKFSIAGLGFKVGIGDILLVVGPILFFFQVLFMLYWFKEQQLLLTNNYEQEFVFPDFNINGSPFSTKNTSQSVPYFFTNFIWALFLILPILILFFGFLTRYDVVSIKLYPNNSDSLLRNLLFYRTTDTISILVDLINLVCLTLSIVVTLFITKKDSCKNEIKYYAKNMLAITILLLLISSIFLYFSFKLDFGFSEYYGFPQYLKVKVAYSLIVIQWLVWIYFTIISLINKSTFVLKICMGAIIINLFLLLL